MPVDIDAARSDSASTRCRRSFGRSRVMGRRGVGIVRGLGWGYGNSGEGRADSNRAAIQCLRRTTALGSRRR